MHLGGLQGRNRRLEEVIMRMNRYVMSWSQADRMWMVVYAACLEDAEEMFEDGIYELEETE